MGSGWIKLHREILEWEWWDDDRMVKMFIYLLLSCNANHRRINGIEVNPGEIIVGRKMLADKLHFPERIVRSTLDKLVLTGEISKWTNNHYTKIKITNWDRYQNANQMSDRTPTKRQPKQDKVTSKNDLAGNIFADQAPTESPTNDHKQENREYIKKVSSNEDTKERASKARPKSAQDVIDYCASRKNNLDGQYFWDKMEARGWVFKDGLPVKDWKACVRTWEKFDIKPRGCGEAGADGNGPNWGNSERDDAQNANGIF